MSKLAIYRAKSSKVDRQERQAAVKRILAEANPKFVEEAERTKSFIDMHASKGLLHAWELGQRMKKLQENENQYGSDAVGRMAVVVENNNLVYFAIRFFTCYPDKKDIDELTAMRRKCGRALTTSHMLHICKIDELKVRKQMITRVCNEDLTPEETDEEIDNLPGGKGPRTGIGGRSLKIPKTVDGVLSNIVQQSYFFTRNADKMWGKFKDQVDRMPADKITPEFLKKLQQGITYQETVQKDSEALEEALLAAQKLAIDRASKQAEESGKAHAARAGGNGSAKKGAKEKETVGAK